MVPQWLIEQKRDGHPLDRGDIRAFIDGFTQGAIPEYQMAAMAMAIYFRGMTEEEVMALTDAMMHSGTVLDRAVFTRPAVDKHSTGGIGDKLSLPLAPLVAACGAAVPMISGRGLGITGGTLDKLESIPGMQTDIDEENFIRIVNSCGCAIIGQTDRLAPADRKLYALRDVTATVPSIPLITASILSKKLAEGISGLILDVKCGRGAFMKDIGSATALAGSLTHVGQSLGTRTEAFITAMDHPLGRTVGNALEVAEALAILRGQGPADATALTLALGARMLVLAGVVATTAESAAALQQALRSGRGLTTLARMIEEQGGNPRVVDNPALLPTAREQIAIGAETDGYLADLDAEALGRATLLLGAGRTRITDAIDHAAGLSDLIPVGTAVSRGDRIVTAHAATPARLEAARPWIAKAIVIGSRPPVKQPLIIREPTEAGMP